MEPANEMKSNPAAESRSNAPRCRSSVARLTIALPLRGGVVGSLRTVITTPCYFHQPAPNRRLRVHDLAASKLLLRLDERGAHAVLRNIRRRERRTQIKHAGLEAGDLGKIRIGGGYFFTHSVPSSRAAIV
jgi:hypothetical protein